MSKRIKTFSILMPVYQGDSYEDVKFTLDNVRELELDEVLIVQDGPISKEVGTLLENYCGLYAYRLLKFSINRGLGACLRDGVENLHSDYFFRIDPGDMIIPGLVAYTKSKVIDLNLDLFGGQMGEFENDPAIIKNKRMVPLDAENIRRYARYRNPFNHITICAKKSAVLGVGNYPFDILRHEDYGLWLSMLQNNKKVANSSNTLALARLGSNFSSRRSGFKYFVLEANFVLKYIDFFKFWSVPYLLIRLPVRMSNLISKMCYGFMRKY